MSALNRRQILKSGAACTAAALLAPSAALAAESQSGAQINLPPGGLGPRRRNNIHQ